MGLYDENVLWMYSYVVSILLLLSIKDTVLVRFLQMSWIVLRRIGFYDDYDNMVKKDEPDSGQQLRILCKEVSDVLVSQSVGWSSLVILLSSSLLTSSSNFSEEKSTDMVFLICFQVARHIYKAYYFGFLEWHPVECLHCVIMSICCVIFLHPGTGATVVILILISGEIGDIHRPLVRILDAYGVACYGRERVSAYLVGVVATVFGRCVLSASLLILAVSFGNAVAMSRSSLVLFFFCITYTLTVSVVMAMVVIDQLYEVQSLRRLYMDATRNNAAKALEFALAMERTSASSGKTSDVWTVPYIP